MPGKVYYSVEFYKKTDLISQDKTVTVEEQFDVCDQAADMVATLVFFATTADSSSIDADSYDIYLKNIRELIGQFMSVINTGLADLANDRDKLKQQIEALLK